MGRQLLLATACAAICVAVAATVIALASGRDAGRPDRAELEALEDRLWDASEKTGELARAGIYLSSSSVGDTCVRASLVNPTAPNIAYLRQRFGPRLCVDRHPMEALSACTGFTLTRRVRDGLVIVPAITGQSIEQAQRRLLRRGLRFTYGCLDDASDVLRPPDRFSPDQLAVIVDQCPRAGERVPGGTAVSYRATTALPGGFRWQTGALPDYNEVDTDRRVCENGRDLWRPRPELRGR